MSLREPVIAALAVSSDAFALSLFLGLKGERGIKAPLAFALSQLLLPLLGGAPGLILRAEAGEAGRLGAFLIMSLTGCRMLCCAGEDCPKRGLSLPVLAILSGGDALSYGMSLALRGMNIMGPALICAMAGFLCSILGLRLGGSSGEKCAGTAARLGGGALYLMALAMLPGLK